MLLFSLFLTTYIIIPTNPRDNVQRHCKPIHNSAYHTTGLLHHLENHNQIVCFLIYSYSHLPLLISCTALSPKNTPITIPSHSSSYSLHTAASHHYLSHKPKHPTSSPSYNSNPPLSNHALLPFFTRITPSFNPPIKFTLQNHT